MNVFEIVFAILAPLFYIVGLTGLFVYIFGKRENFQTILPIALISVTLFVFFTTLIFHSLTVAFWITVAASFSFIPLLIFDRKRRVVLKQLFTPGLVLFILLYGFVVLLSWYKIVPLLSDSTMHWAPHVWTMWQRDDFYTSPGLSIVIHGDYPPIVQLFELLWSKAAGTYREGLLFAAITILSFSMLFPAIKNFRWKRGIVLPITASVVLLLVLFIALPLAFSATDFYTSLDVDTLLGVAFAYGLVFAIKESRKFSLQGVVKLSLIVTFICLIKQIAVLLAGLIIIAYVLGLLLTYRKNISFKKLSFRFTLNVAKVKKYRRQIIAVLLAIALPIVAVQAWSAQTEGYVSPDPGVAIFHLNPGDLIKLPDVFMGNAGSEAQQNFSRSYISHVLFAPAGITLNFLNALAFIQVALLAIGCMIIIWYKTRQQDNKNRALILTGVLSVGLGLYLFALYAVFLFGGMKDIELNTIELTSRYINTYLIAMILVPLLILLEKLTDTSLSIRFKQMFIALLLIIIVLFGVFINKTSFDRLGIKNPQSWGAVFPPI